MEYERVHGRGLCVSALLGFPLKKIAWADPHHRIQELWKLVQTPPWAALFWSGGRLSAPGFGWAPKSLLGDRVANFTQSTLVNGSLVPYDYEFEDHAEELSLGNRGLQFRREGFDLGRWNATIKSSFWICSDTQPFDGYLVTRVPSSVTNHRSPQDIQPNGTKGDERNLHLVFSQPWIRYATEAPFTNRGMSALLLSTPATDYRRNPINARIEGLCIFRSTSIVDSTEKTAVGQLLSNLENHKSAQGFHSGRLGTQVWEDPEGFTQYTEQGAMIAFKARLRSAYQQWCVE